jgi:4-oxalmesaconate hydratase
MPPGNRISGCAAIAFSGTGPRVLAGAPAAQGVFDSCVYHQPGIDLLAKVIPVDKLLFASEMIGALRGVDPDTGFNFDDTWRHIDAAALTPEARHQVFEGNARRVYARLDAGLKAQGR